MTDGARIRPGSPTAPLGPLAYSSWFGDLGGGELRMLDHLRATAFGTGATKVLLNQSGRLEEELRDLGIRSQVIRWHGGSNFLARQLHWYVAWARTWFALSRLEPSVTVCNTFFDLETTGRVAAQLRLPLIWRARADTFPNAHTWRAGRLEELVGFLNHRVERILATTEYEARMMVDAGVSDAKVFVVRNGVDLKRYDDERAGRKLRAQLGLGDADFVVGYVARMVPQKGYETFIDALATLKRDGVRMRAIVAGDTTLLEDSPDAYKRALLERVRRNGLENNISFLGFRDDVNAVMKASDVFVLASLKEPFGTTAIEAMAAGRPVVASDLPGPRESVREDETGVFFPTGDAAALAQRLRQLQAAPARRAALGRAGRARVEAVFDVNRNVAELDRHCVDVARTTGRRRERPMVPSGSKASST